MRCFVFILMLLMTNVVYAAEICIKDNICYQAPIMRTKKELQKGLMHVRDLPKNQGMLFDFNGYSMIAMWMKNTYIPLDMLFIDCTFKVTDVYENAKPLSLDLIKPSRKTCYVLEFNAGEVKANDIKIGDDVTIKQ